ncbi:MAG TPA: glycosyltransferase [Gemmatimonadales bacterium]|nr:glycosyltransferase [Gemmatimonadales bacterium]
MHILWIKTELLHPVDKGGRIRTYNMLRALRRRHRVTYLTLDSGTAEAAAVARASEYCDRLIRIPFTEARRGSLRFWGELVANLLSSLPYAVAKYRSPGMRREITRAVEEGEVDLLVCDFLFPSQNVPAGLPCRTVLFQHNVEAMIWKRHVEVRTHPLARAYFRRQWDRMRRFEAAECRRFDQVVAVSRDDAETLEREYGLRGVVDIPTGVDVDYFAPSGTVTQSPRELVFTGSMDWLPNEDGILWFVEEVLPLIHATMPDVSLTVVGRKPPARIAALAERDSRLRVTGTVPDVRPYLERAAVIVVPLRVGGGTRLKIYEALAMERGLVSTTIGSEGLPIVDGEHALIADRPEAFADAVLRLLGDPAEARRLGTRGAEFVRTHFRWERVADDFAERIGALPAAEGVGG